MQTVKLFLSLVLCAFLFSCTGNSLNVTAEPLYDVVPVVENCTAGILSEMECQKVLLYINSIRTTHGLPLVEYDKKKEKAVQEAALIGASNSNVTDAVSDADLCFTLNGAQECANGNRSLWGSATADWTTSEIHVNDWMLGLNSGNTHYRRRILDPFLKTVTFGRVIGTPRKGDYKYVSSAVLSFGYGNVDLSESSITYVAYPCGVYTAKTFDPEAFLSFSVLNDKNVRLNNGVAAIDFSGATVSVSLGSQILDIVEDSFTYDYGNYGLPNNLQWKVNGLVKGASYTVKISGVTVNGETKNYEYSFSFK
jgi:hypothetical protein